VYHELNQGLMHPLLKACNKRGYRPDYINDMYDRIKFVRDYCFDYKAEELFNKKTSELLCLALSVNTQLKEGKTLEDLFGIQLLPQKTLDQGMTVSCGMYAL
jgi:hypothetical protein